MCYSAIAVANAFIIKAQQNKTHNLTPMKLQKLMFFAQSWHLKTNENKELLFNSYFERWQYGPVLPEIYHEFKAFGSNNIDRLGSDLFLDCSEIKDVSTLNFIDKIIEVYGGFSGSELSWMTHQQETAWSKEQIGTVISIQDMISSKV